MNSTSRHIGAHSIRLEPPDIACITQVGQISADEMAAMIAALRRLTGGERGCFTIVDLSRSAGISPEARRVATDARHLLLGSAVLGASFTLRASISILRKAMIMLRRDEELALAFFDAEDEARAWIEAERRRRAG